MLIDFFSLISSIKRQKEQQQRNSKNSPKVRHQSIRLKYFTLQTSASSGFPLLFEFKPIFFRLSSLNDHILPNEILSRVDDPTKY